jgi:hypothetical protein
MAAMLLALGLPAMAQAQSAPDLTSKLLIAILVKKGVLSQSDADTILAQAQAAASAAQASAAAAPPTPASPVTVTSTTTPDGTIHVTYIPPVVRDQITSAVASQITAQQQSQGYTGYSEVPAWVSRVHISGDFRFRDEEDLFPPGNADDGHYPNFNAVNTGSPYLFGGTNQPSELNVDENRNRLQLRARLAVTADLSDGFTLGFRLATGSNNSPVSENQTLAGAPNGAQGGGFSKDAIWLDRAYLAYVPQLGSNLDLKLELGRFDNPFFSTNMIWADDLGFDGAAAMASYRAGDAFTPFVTAGAFPVYNTDFSFPSNQSVKSPSHDKWLFALQAGTDWKISGDYAAKLGVADYLFANVAGKLSAPCTVLSSADLCSTDDDRPAFAQNGNTYMALRNITPEYSGGVQLDNSYQYFGLASGFNELALTGEFDISNFVPTDIWLNGEYVRNLAFNKNDINGKATELLIQNNLDGNTYVGGDTGYYINANIGQKVLLQRWDWNAMLGYKYIESDAVVDAFNDSDFGLGGTNLKGYIIGGNLAFSKRVWARMRYLSADSIAGPPYKADVFQLDLNAKF